MALPTLPAGEDAPRLLLTMLARHRVHVRRWRRSMSGMAWNAPGPDGPLTRWIEAPRPRSSLSWSIVLHEVGHHALGIGRFSPRCLEEYHAWRWSLEAMDSMGISIDDRVRQRVRDSLHYAIDKARRRGIASLPAELERFLRGENDGGTVETVPPSVGG